jgi:hypothetical protein
MPTLSYPPIAIGTVGADHFSAACRTHLGHMDPSPTKAIPVMSQGQPDILVPLAGIVARVSLETGAGKRRVKAPRPAAAPPDLRPFEGEAPTPELSLPCPLRKADRFQGENPCRGVPGSGLLATLPSGPVILRPVSAPNVTRAALLTVRLSLSASERLSIHFVVIT